MKPSESHRDHKQQQNGEAHRGLNNTLIQAKALQDKKLAPLTQHSGCCKSGSAPVAESSKGASK